MKDKLSGAMKKFSGAIVQPIMFMAVTGIILSAGVILRMDNMPALLKGMGDFLYNLMMNGGINQLSVIFCVGITVALAKRKKTDAAVVSLSMFLFFIYANNAWLTSHNMLAEAGAFGLSGTGQAMVLGVQVVDMGVLLGILLGCICGYVFNKYCDITFPDAVSVYGGTRFVYLVLTFVTIALAIAMCYVWPVVNNAINACGQFIESSGNLGLFIYGFLNRILIPTGMHHLIYMPFLFTPVGGSVKMGDTIVSGAQMIYMAQLGNIQHISALDPSVKYLMFGFSKVFGCIGIVLAFIKTAKPKNKAKIKGMLLPLLFVAVLAGITEPLEFSFMFISPLLWVVHSVLDGLFQVIVFVLGCRAPFSGGLIAFLPILLTVPMQLSKWYILFGVGLVGIAVWYFSFVFLINKFDMKTPGREDTGETDTQQSTDSKSNALGDVNDIIEGLGGAENINQVTNCFTRLRVDVKDLSKLDESKINKFKNNGIVKKGNNVQIIIGMKVQSVREDVCQILHMD